MKTPTKVKTHPNKKGCFITFFKNKTLTGIGANYQQQKDIFWYVRGHETKNDIKLEKKMEKETRKHKGRITIILTVSSETLNKFAHITHWNHTNRIQFITSIEKETKGDRLKQKYAHTTGKHERNNATADSINITR